MLIAILIFVSSYSAISNVIELAAISNVIEFAVIGNVVFVVVSSPHQSPRCGL